jgi:hypothetical protein
MRIDYKLQISKWNITSMKNISYLNNIKSQLISVICGFVLLTISGCYSFTGGSIPEHLKTLQIAAVEDRSGYGNPTYRDVLTSLIFSNFRSDNSFKIVESNGDARLAVVIVRVTDVPQTVQANEIASGNKLTITCDIEYYDAVQKKQIWKQTVTAYNTYDVESDAQGNRDKAARTVLTQTADDILLKVVSGW